MTRRSVALAVVALALGWRLVASLAGAAEQLAQPDSRGRSLRERFAAFDEPLAARSHRSLGFADPIFAAVAQAVPDDGLLVVRLEPSQRNESLAMVLYDLLWPRRIFVTDGELLAALPPELRGSDRLYALLLADAAPPDANVWERVQGDRRCTIWRAKGPPR